MLNTFITYQKKIVTKNFMSAAVRRSYLTWILFTPMCGNASHRVIKIAVVILKCKESERLIIFGLQGPKS